MVFHRFYMGSTCSLDGISMGFGWYFDGFYHKTPHSNASRPFLGPRCRGDTPSDLALRGAICGALYQLALGTQGIPGGSAQGGESPELTSGND